MVDLETHIAREIPERELRMVAMRALNTARLALHRAVAHHAEPQSFPIPSNARSLERLFLARFQRLRPEARRGSVEKVLPLITKPLAERIRIYGDLVNVNLKSTASVRAQVQALPLPPEIKTAIEQIRRRVTASVAREPLQPETVPAQTARSLFGGEDRGELLELRIRSVKCIEETREAGKDEVFLAGLSFDLCRGTTTLITPFKVGKFKTGTEIPYEPPRPFIRFRLGKDAEPVPFAVTLVLAEKDWGGLDKRLNDLHTVADREFLEELVMVGVAATLVPGIPFFMSVGLATAGLLGGIAGVLVPVLVAAAIYLLIDVLPKLLSDDIFPEVPIFQAVGPLNSRLPSGGSVTPEQKELFIGPRGPGFGGKYEVRFDWRVAT
jgi:hypothetical protein